MKRLTFANFGKFRIRWLYEADRITESIPEYLTQPPQLSARAARDWGRAAKLAERASHFYARAGFSLMAKSLMEDASTFYAAVGRSDDSQRCHKKSESFPSYYEEEK